MVLRVGVVGFSCQFAGFCVLVFFVLRAGVLCVLCWLSWVSVSVSLVLCVFVLTA